MTGSHVRLSSSIAPEAARPETTLDRVRSTPGGTGRSLRTAVAPLAVGLRRAAGGGDAAWRHARAADAWHSEEDRMRLFAALLVLATLLVWILFLQG
jgi:hypothetical protein